MLIAQLKPKDDILSLAKGKTIVISCGGCKEVYFPEIKASDLQKSLLVNGTAIVVIETDYVCSPENLGCQVQKYIDSFDIADNVLVFSCGVGVQAVAEKFADMPVYAACDSYPLPGYQGVTPLEYDCAQCGECYLNHTGGICPITACSKSLVNGQCGGSKNGKCEVDDDIECGWERIYRQLERLASLDKLHHPVRVRDFTK